MKRLSGALILVTFGTGLFLSFQNFTSSKNLSTSAELGRFSKMMTASGFYSEEKILVGSDGQEAEYAHDGVICQDHNQVVLSVLIEHELRSGDQIKLKVMSEQGLSQIYVTHEGEAGVSVGCGDLAGSELQKNEVRICLSRADVKTAYVQLQISDYRGEQIHSHVPLEGSCILKPQIVHLH